MRELGGSTRRWGWIRAAGVLLVAFSLAAARVWRGTAVGVPPLVVVTAAAILTLTSDRWKCWARRHRAADFIIGLAAVWVIADQGSADFTPWTVRHCVLAAAALLTVSAGVSGWRRWIRRPAAG